MIERQPISVPPMRGPLVRTVLLLARLLLEFAVIFGLLWVCAEGPTVGVVVVALLIVLGSEVAVP